MFRRRITGTVAEKECTRNVFGRPITLYTVVNGAVYRVAQGGHPELPEVGDLIKLSIFRGRYLHARYVEPRDILWEEISRCKVLEGKTN